MAHRRRAPSYGSRPHQRPMGVGMKSRTKNSERQDRERAARPRRQGFSPVGGWSTSVLDARGGRPSGSPSSRSTPRPTNHASQRTTGASVLEDPGEHGEAERGKAAGAQDRGGDSPSSVASRLAARPRCPARRGPRTRPARRASCSRGGRGARARAPRARRARRSSPTLTKKKTSIDRCTHCAMRFCLRPEEGEGDVAAVELTDREQVDHRHEHPRPAREGDGREHQLHAGGDRRREEVVEEREGGASRRAACPASVASSGTTSCEWAAPHAYSGIASARPASGPAAPMSSRARRVGMTDRIRMTAPIVPNGERTGSGMKKGSDASTLWRRAAM